MPQHFDRPRVLPHVRSALAVVVAVVIASVGACANSAPSAAPASGGPAATADAPAPSQTASIAPPTTTSPSASPSEAGIRRAAAPMKVGRVGFDAVVLGDGSVLVVGDDHDCFGGGAMPGSERAEVYEPASDRWVEIESLNKPRKVPATVPLADGSAMVIGGVNDQDVPFSSTKILSPSTRTWTNGPLLDVARGSVHATALRDGRVLAASSFFVTETSSLTTTEIYDPRAGAWTGAARLDGVSLDALVPLTDGRVLGVGSAFEISLWLEVYDPDKNTWTTIETPNEGHFRPHFVALDDGAILAVGGYAESAAGSGPTAQAERYDPHLNHWFDVAPMSTARAEAAVVRGADGRVLVIGGYAGQGDSPKDRALGTVDVFDLATDSFTATGDLLEPRYDARAVVLGDGSVLVMGGANTFDVTGETPWCPPPMTSVERVAAP